jgi:primosomal protein N' (replication factor Y)
VLIQTYNPDHPAIRAAVRHDYVAFATAELPIRKSLLYPPFSSMIRLVVRGPVEKAAGEFAALLADRVSRTLGSAARVLGPAPAPLSKLRGKYRFHVQLQGPDGAALRQAVREAARDAKTPEQVQWIADVDPLDML